MVRDSLRTTLLAAAILPFIAAPLAHAGNDAGIATDAATASYLIRFAEPGVFEARVGVDLSRFAPQSPEVIERRADLMRTQSAHEVAIAAALGRQPLVTHHYLASRSGIAARLTEAEAERLRSLAGIVAVIPDRVEYLATFRTPAFIGADTIWDGSATPDLVGTRGEGTIVGIIDTGITPNHPSFADSATCSDDGIGAKLLSYVDCTTTDVGGRCNGPDPIDHVGHGTHTAATAAGSRVEANGDAPPLAISGIAPCAHIRAYKACPGTSCSYSYLIAAMDNVLLDGDVDVINYSIAGGTDPWVDTDRTKLDLAAAGVFVAASAGNTNPAQTNPVGRVNHLGPWVVSVAASTHDVWADGLLDVTAPDAPDELADIQLYKGSDSPNLAATATLPIRHFADQPAAWEGCSASIDGAPADVAAFPPGFFAGAAALVRNAGCPLATQIDNAHDAGAELVLIRADAMSDNTHLQTPGQADVSAYGIEQAPGDALVAFVDANPDSASIAVQPVQGDALAGFSLRGPTAQIFSGLTKPDVSAPGVRVYSAFASGNGYAYLDGTSMASPHVAGAAALLRSAHPDWSVQEIASALMTTAKTEGVDDTWARHWDWDDVGSGRIDLQAAARAGFVLDESIDHFLAANPVGGSLAARDLNRASVRDVNCTPSCTWARELRGTRAEETHWIVSTSALSAGLDIRVAPSVFSLAADDNAARGLGDSVFADGFDPPPPGRSQVIAITAIPPSDASGALAFGQVVLTEVDGLAPPQHITVTVSGTSGGSGQPDIGTLPAVITADADSGGDVVTRTLVIANNDNGALDWAHVTEQTAGDLWNQPASGTAGILSSESTSQDGGVYTANDFHLAARTLLTTIRTPGIDAGAVLVEQSAITWAIYPDLAGKPAGNPQTAPEAAVWHYSSPPGGAGVSVEEGEIRLDLEAAGQSVDLPAGLYWLSVFPTYDNDVTGSAPHWKWLQASRADLGAQLIAPSIWGVTNWSPITSMGVGFSDTAFGLEGLVGGKVDCDAAWFAVSPATGHIEGTGAQEVSVRLDPGQLAPGTHAASLCFDSNDPDEPTVIVPVTFTVGNG